MKVIPFYSKLYNGYQDFSNFAYTPFEISSKSSPTGRLRFISSEQFIMWSKAVLFKDFEVRDKILKETDPLAIKKLGRTVKNFKEDVWKGWDAAILKQALTLKFSQNEGLKKKLLETGDAILAEANMFDKKYGAGLSGNDPKINDPAYWKGYNMMGNTLMEVRSEFQAELNKHKIPYVKDIEAKSDFEME